jgi:hypothetical protein
MVFLRFILNPKQSTKNLITYLLSILMILIMVSFVFGLISSFINRAMIEMFVPGAEIAIIAFGWMAFLITCPGVFAVFLLAFKTGFISFKKQSVFINFMVYVAFIITGCTGALTLVNLICGQFFCALLLFSFCLLYILFSLTLKWEYSLAYNNEYVSSPWEDADQEF